MLLRTVIKNILSDGIDISEPGLLTVSDKTTRGNQNGKNKNRFKG